MWRDLNLEEWAAEDIEEFDGQEAGDLPQMQLDLTP